MIRNYLKFWIFVLFLVAWIWLPGYVAADSQGYSFGSPVKDTVSSYTKNKPQMIISGEKVYLVWSESDGFNDQLWAGEINIDGTGWSSNKLTSTAFNKRNPQLEQVGSKIYYVWEEYDGSRYQIWTGVMNTDGTGFQAVKRTSSSNNKYNPQMDTQLDKIYYVWEESISSRNQVVTASMNIDGTSWSAVQRTFSAYDKNFIQLKVVNNAIYYTWNALDESGGPIIDQIWTGYMNTDGTGWSAVQRTNLTYNNYAPNLDVVDGKIYLSWLGSDVPNHVWTASMNTDGTGWSAASRTNAINGMTGKVELQVIEDKIYYIYVENDGVNYQIWTASMDTTGANWLAEKRSTSAFSKINPVFSISGTNIFYVWSENDGSYYQVWTAKGNFYQKIDKVTDVTATVPQSLQFSVFGVNSGQSVNGSVTNILSTNTGINFGILNGSSVVVAAQDLSVQTNATDGYTVAIKYDHVLQSTSDIIVDFTGSNTVPVIWSSPVGVDGYFGYTSEDNSLGTGVVDRFVPNKWSGLSTLNSEVMFHDHPADGITPGEGATRIGYKLEVTDWQTSGSYSNTVTYTCSPVY